MGLFGNLFKSDKKVSFLEEADLAYTKAFQVKSAAGLDAYFTRKCLRSIVEKINHNEKSYAGLTRYQNITWKKENDNSYLKIVTYDDVQISKGISASVGEPYTERWVVVIENDVKKIAEIRRCG